jgi:hypothetical protein
MFSEGTANPGEDLEDDGEMEAELAEKRLDGGDWRVSVGRA